MIRRGAAARQTAISSGSPLTMPMMLRRSITAIVSRITCSSDVAAGIGRSQGGTTFIAIPATGPRAGSERGMTANGAHMGGTFAPT